MTRFIFIGLLFSMFVAACGPLAASTPEMPQATPTAPTGEWTLLMTHSGGIMGLRRTVEITNAGQMTVTDERADKTVSTQLSKDELVQLQKLVSEASYTAPKTPMGCADCFIYEVTIQRGAGKPFTATVDDTSIEASGMSPLVTFVRTLMEKALKS
jgi:hypothetical protein